MLSTDTVLDRLSLIPARETIRAFEPCATMSIDIRRPHARHSAAARCINSNDPVLSWLIFTGLTLLAIHPALVLRTGAEGPVLRSDPHHGLHRADLRCRVAALSLAFDGDLARGGGRAEPCAWRSPAPSRSRRRPTIRAMPGLVAAHVRNLAMKSDLTGDGRTVRSDHPAARAGRTAERDQQFRRLRRRSLNEARALRHDRRLHHDAGADRRAQYRGSGRDQVLHGAHERWHGRRHVHDTRRPRGIDPHQDPVPVRRKAQRPGSSPRPSR